MLSFDDIKSRYPENIHGHDIDILKEYLQCKILEIIFDSKIGKKLSFIGDTSLRILYNTQRFSEDLDFDCFDLQKNEFEEVSQILKNKLALEGCNIEVKTLLGKQVLHYYIKILNLLFQYKLSSHTNEKILIKVDVQAQGFNYSQEKKLLDKFDVLTYINTTPVDILLSMKLNTIFSRKRSQGRDFYDIVFLCTRTKPNYDFLKQKLNISNAQELRKEILIKCKELNFEKLTKDVEALLINSIDLKKVLLFHDFIKQAEF